MDELKPKGVVVVVEAEHLCMSIRGIKKPGAITVTSAVRGLFRTNPSSRGEVFCPDRKGEKLNSERDMEKGKPDYFLMISIASTC